MKKDFDVLKIENEIDDSYVINFLDITTIYVLVRDARSKILEMEMNNPKGLLDAELIKKVQEVKYKLGHLLTREK